MTDFYSNYLSMIKSEKNNYSGAGFIFYEKNNLEFDFLLGLENNPGEKINTLSIFGGHKDKKDKNSLYTAVREIFEELFNVHPNGLDIFVSQIQQKVDDYTIIEKVFVKGSNEVCYFADISILNMFIQHLMYHDGKWPFKNSSNKWSEYYNNIHMFINDRILKNNQKVKDGLNEIKQIFLIKYKTIDYSIRNKIPIIINKKEYYLKANLSKYLQDSIIIDILNKNL